MKRSKSGIVGGVLLAGAALGLGPARGTAHTFYVPLDQPTIQAAINAALAGDTVRVLPGTYTGPGNDELDFLGKDIVVAGFGPEVSIIDLGGRHPDPCVRFHGGESRAAVLRDLTFQNGHWYMGPSGIVIEGASPSVINVKLYRVSSEQYGYTWGTALQVSGGSPLFQGLQVRQCSMGGAVLVGGGQPEFVDCRFEYNSSGEYASGGALLLLAGRASFRGCSFIGNWADVSGGAIYTETQESVTIESCRFEANVAGAEEWEGAAGGGGVALLGGQATIDDTVFIENHAGIQGGALLIAGGAVGVAGCEFLRNGAASGAAAAIVDATAEITNSTIADCDGNAIACSGTGEPWLRNLIIAGGTSGAGIQTADVTCVPRVICCDVYGFPEGPYGGILPDLTGLNGNISVNPLFCGDAHPEQPLAISSYSPCAPAQNSCGELMGTYEPACDFLGYSIAGTVRDGSEQPLPGVELPGLPGTPHTNDEGHFECLVAAGTDLVLQPLLPGHAFQPPLVTITNLDQDWTNIDFTGTAVSTHRVPEDHPDIAAAIAAAQEGDTVLIAPGTYVGPGNRNLNPHGKNLVIRSVAGSESTTIDLEGLGRFIVYADDESSASSLEGLTILNGDAEQGEATWYGRYGGALYIDDASPALLRPANLELPCFLRWSLLA